MKTVLLLTLGLIALGIYGLLGNMELNDLKTQKAVDTCSHQNDQTIPTFDQCLSNQYEANNDK